MIGLVPEACSRPVNSFGAGTRYRPVQTEDRIEFLKTGVHGDGCECLRLVHSSTNRGRHATDWAGGSTRTVHDCRLRPTTRMQCIRRLGQSSFSVPYCSVYVRTHRLLLSGCCLRSAVICRVPPAR